MTAMNVLDWLLLLPLLASLGLVTAFIARFGILSPRGNRGDREPRLPVVVPVPLPLPLSPGGSRDA